MELPIATETKRALQFAAEEADRLLHNYIGTEHVLLGVLREERCVAALILVEKGDASEHGARGHRPVAEREAAWTRPDSSRRHHGRLTSFWRTART